MAEDDPVRRIPDHLVVGRGQHSPVDLEGYGAALAGAVEGGTLDVEAALWNKDGGRAGGGAGSCPGPQEGLA